MESLEAFGNRSREWLIDNAQHRSLDADRTWGDGSDEVALFQFRNDTDERQLLDARRAWVACKADAGFANLSWDVEWGGQGLTPAHEELFASIEAEFDVPADPNETITITTKLIAPTIRVIGTEEQRRRFLRPMLRTDEMWCQLFSEPGAGSDLASLTTAAVRDGDEWRISGQKVWTSGAQFADWAYVLCRTDSSVPKHRGITAFIVPMSSQGIEVRPLRQMTGGASFNEVFFTDVRVPDELRLGGVGDGWTVAVTTLSFERNGFGPDGGVPDAAQRLIALARHEGREHDPLVRQALARAYIRQRIVELTCDRLRPNIGSENAPGPEGSIGKMTWTVSLQAFNEAASIILGPKLIADAEQWGTYAWSAHVLGAPGYRIAGGSDEVQRNIIGERILGLPSEPLPDRNLPFEQVPR